MADQELDDLKLVQDLPSVELEVLGTAQIDKYYAETRSLRLGGSRMSTS